MCSIVPTILDILYTIYYKPDTIYYILYIINDIQSITYYIHEWLESPCKDNKVDRKLYCMSGWQSQ